ncbi:MAG: hypothetical protein NC123_05525 [Butyrivibrio sp.]|nr:hypothetical protein [Acetatifactor muris]MCM1558988.1 hypothetical protein [Butyrivibrio sp.]
MWECEYSREPVDYRLLWLRFLRKLWILPIAAFAGIVLVGACYFYARTGARGGRTYQAESFFYIDFAEDARGEQYDYYNFYTWSEVIHTDFFVDYVYEKKGGALSEDEIMSYITATVDSDGRYLYVRCDTHSPELSMELASVMEEIVPKFADTRKEIRSIELVRAGDSAKDSSKLRMGNACFLGGCLGLGTAVVWILIALITDTAVYLPAAIEKRYHITCLGAPFMPEFAPNWKYVLQESVKVARVFADPEVQAEGWEIPTEDWEIPGDKKRELINCKNPVEHPEELDRIRECQAVLLVLRAGRRNNKIFERLLEQLGRQDIKVTAVVLASADEKLLSAYYRSRK